MSKKALVVNPYITDFKLYDEWMHPAGLYFLIDLLNQNGIETCYFNCLGRSSTKKFSTGDFQYQEIEKPELFSTIKRLYKLYGKPEQVFRKFLLDSPKPDTVYIGSLMSYWAPGVIKTAQIIRSIFPEVPIVIGGIAAQLIPHYFTANIDNCLVVDSLNSKNTLQKLALSEKKAPSLIPGFKLLPEDTNHGPVLLSLGCPMRCSYCASSILQPQYQNRPLETVLSEIDYLVDRFGVTDFAFFDDALLYKPEVALIPLLNSIRLRGHKLRFHTPNGLHLRYLDEMLIDQLFDSGFMTLRFGYESGNSKYKKDTSTKITETELIKKVDLLKSAGFSNRDLGLYIMGGLKEQMPDDMLTEMDYIGSLGVKVKPVFISPVPQTILFEYYAQQFPLLRLDPLWQNDSFFITCLTGWDHAAVESVRVRAKDINSKIGLNISRRTDIRMERPLPLTRNSNSKVNQGELLQHQAEITTKA